MMKNRATFVLIGGIFLTATQAFAQAPAVAAPDALTELNKQFRASYAAARADVLRGSYPVLVYDGLKLVLLVDGRRRLEGGALPAVYHRLKALAHLPFTIHLELRGFDGALSDERHTRLVELRKLLAAVEAEMRSYEFGPYSPERQRELLLKSAEFVDQVIGERRCTATQLAEFATTLGPLMHENTLAAAEVELGHYHREIDGWLGDLPDEERRRLRVVVCGSQMPRAGHRIVQLAAAMLGESGEGARIVYAEAIYEEERALNLLGTHRLDAESAAAFFGDATRLDRDILAAGARKYVREKFGAAKP